MSLVPGPPRTKFVVATGTCHLPPRGCGGCVPRVQTQAPGCLLRTEGGGGGGLLGGGVVGGTRPRYLIVCLWRRLLASRHCSF